ncbi:hypothetical protein Sste5344_008817 [Sporothrix stenoceras]
MFNEAAAYTAEDLEQEEKAVKKRLDRTLLPMEWIVFSPLLVGNQYSSIASAYSYGIIVWNIPANYLMQQLPVAKFISVMIIL